ncbi:MAG: hypothetical protein WC996_06340 [Peptostreptococcales bacterium]
MVNIGGEFPLNLCELSNFNSNVQKNLGLEDYFVKLFSSGRGALRALLRKIDRKRALLPSYLCHSVVQAFSTELYDISFYESIGNGGINVEVLKERLRNVDVFLIIHYFGFPFKSEILDQIRETCTKLDVVIIEDSTQSIFTTPLFIGDYGFASLRKWAGIPDGGVAYAKSPLLLEENYSINDLFCQKRCIGMMQRSIFLAGIATDYLVHLEYLQRAEELLNNESGIFSISPLSKSLISSIDFITVKRKRRENYKVLFRLLKNTKIEIITPQLTEYECPLFLVIRVARRDYLRSQLAEKGIFCPVHWPIEDDTLLQNQLLKNWTSKVLSIPIDQRYGIQEMKYIAKTLLSIVNAI